VYLCGRNGAAEDMIDELIKIGIYCGMEINLEKTKAMRMEYFKYLGRMINDARCTHEIKSRLAMVKASFNKTKVLSTSKLGLNLWNTLVKCYVWNMALYGAETWTVWKLNQKYLESV
jgi:hypothetical protein